MLLVELSGVAVLRDPDVDALAPVVLVVVSELDLGLEYLIIRNQSSALSAP